jgi:hypothetical protein
MSAAAKAPKAPSTTPGFPQEYTRPDQTPLTQEVPVQGRLTIELKSK